jgi:hypothetical protein
MCSIDVIHAFYCTKYNNTFVFMMGYTKGGCARKRAISNIKINIDRIVS